MKRLRVAVVGAGRLGGFHAQKLAARDDVELVGVADPVALHRTRVAAECRTQPLTDFRELIGRIDAAVVAAPTRLHYAIGLDLLRAGVHVLMEKPLTATSGQADALVQAARDAGVVLQVGHVERFNPALATAAPHLRTPKYLEAVRSGPATFRSMDVGVVLDLMIHDIDLVLSLVRAPVRRVEAFGLSVLGGHEDVANARIHFASGAIAALSACRVAHAAVRRMQVWTARGFASIDFAARTATLVRPSELLLRRRFNVETITPEELDHHRQHFMEEHLPESKLSAEAVDALALEIDDFLAAIRTPRAPRVTGEQGRDAVAVAEQILAKIQTHAWDDDAEGPIGPMAAPRTRVVPSPHFELTPLRPPLERKEAG